jgi:formate hydrogenlyase subunit 3
MIMPLMLDPLPLLTLALAAYVISGILSALLASFGKVSSWLSALGGLIASAATFCAALSVLLGGALLSARLPGINYPVELSQLNALLLVAISLPALFGSIYSLAWLQSATVKNRRQIALLSAFFLAAMTLVVLADNSIALLLALEVAALCAYFMIIQPGCQKSRRAGLNQFLFGRAGTLLLVLAFALLYHATGSTHFSVARASVLSPLLASGVFVLAFLGFAMLAGVIPLHGWVPQAHSSAPAHISALFSSGLMKLGVLGIVKIGLDLLGVPPLWWGIVVLLLAVLTAFVGGLYALMEHDIKRLLAYHSLENIGIILLGIGGAMVGSALHQPTLAMLALMGGLFHLFNHGLFKSALFLGAGEIEQQLGIKDIEKMGGLARIMPCTAVAMLIALMSMSALPPLNGFVSEWFIYQSLFNLSGQGLFITRLLGPLLAVGLAITGALAVMCVAKVFGVSFLGKARSPLAEKATRAPRLMTFSTAMLALLCLLSGVASPWLLPVLARICAAFLNAPQMDIAAQASLYPGAGSKTWVSPPLMALLLLSLPLLPLLISVCLRAGRLPNRTRGEAWSCGYGYSSEMAVTASGFAQPLRVMFAPIYRLRKIFMPDGLVSLIHRDCLAAFCRRLAIVELAILLVVAIA